MRRNVLLAPLQGRASPTPSVASAAPLPLTPTFTPPPPTGTASPCDSPATTAATRVEACWAFDNGRLGLDLLYIPRGGKVSGKHTVHPAVREAASEDGAVVIEALKPALAPPNLAAGDIMVSINDRDVRGMTLTQTLDVLLRQTTYPKRIVFERVAQLAATSRRVSWTPVPFTKLQPLGSNNHPGAGASDVVRPATSPPSSAAGSPSWGETSTRPSTALSGSRPCTPLSDAGSPQPGPALRPLRPKSKLGGVATTAPTATAGGSSTCGRPAPLSSARDTPPPASPTLAGRSPLTALRGQSPTRCGSPARAASPSLGSSPLRPLTKPKAVLPSALKPLPAEACSPLPQPGRNSPLP